MTKQKAAYLKMMVMVPKVEVVKVQSCDDCRGAIFLGCVIKHWSAWAYGPNGNGDEWKKRRHPDCGLPTNKKKAMQTWPKE